MKNHNTSILLWSFVVLLFHVSAGAAVELYSVESRDAPVRDMIRLLAQMDGKNIVIPGTVEGTTTASFPEISLDAALKSVLESNELAVSLANDVLHVSTQKSLEAQGRDLVTTTFHLKYARAKDVYTQAKVFAVGRGSVSLDDRSNSITLRGTPSQVQSISSLVENIDKLDKQVLIEAKIVEASKNFTRDFGVQWGVSNNVGPLKLSGLAAVGTGDAGRPLMSGAKSANPLAGLTTAIGPFGGTFLDIQLSAGEESGQLEVLSRPSIVTMNNQPATIRSGVKFFVKTAGSVTIASGGGGAGGGSAPGSSAGAAAPAGGAAGGFGDAGASSGVANGASTGGSNLQEIDSGIKLTVTPQITADNRISLVINVTSSQPDYSNLVDGIPSIADNTATTTVLLEDGQTTVIAGLVQLKDSDGSRGIPFMHRIPVLGALFGAKSKQKSNRELLVFLTPTVVKESLKQLKK